MSEAILQAGAEAPGFSLGSSTGKTISLQDFRGNKPVVLFFYPKADTPGCTKEACGFRDALSKFDEAKLAVLGISPDPVKAVEKFSGKFSLNFPLLADENHAVAEAYGVWQLKKFMGREYMGAARTTFLIDRNGRIVKVFEQVKPEGHEQEVLAWAKENL